MQNKRHKKKHIREDSKNIHNIIQALRTFFEFLQLLKAIYDFFH